MFEPGRPEIIATCGGRFLCVLNVDTGELLLKYCHKNKNQDFFSLSWTTTPECGNVLASGSSLGEIRLYHLAKEVSFYSWIYKKYKFGRLSMMSIEGRHFFEIKKIRVVTKKSTYFLPIFETILIAILLL